MNRFSIIASLTLSVQQTIGIAVAAGLLCSPFAAAQTGLECNEPQVSTGSREVLSVAPETGTSVTLTWQAAARAGSYDVFLGPLDPPAIYAEGIGGTTLQVSGLAAGTRYFWYVVARAECDPSLTSRSATRSFTVDGACPAVGGVSLSSPANNATGVSVNPTFTWSAASGAASYELSLGRENPPPLITSGHIGTTLDIPRLVPNTTYFWRVVGRSGCNASASSSSQVFSFKTTQSCPAPSTPSIVFAPRGDVSVGQVYAVSWSELDDLDAGGSFLVERSSDASFSSILDHQQTTATAASFISTSSGTLHHRVRAIAGCSGTSMSAWSASRSVRVVSGSPNVVFSLPASPVIMPVGDRLEDLRSSFAIENIGPSPVSVLVGRQEISSVPFFQIIDPFGGDSSLLTLQPREPKTLELRFSGPPNATQGSYQGIVTLATPGEQFAVTPMSWVSLRVGGASASPPAFLVNGIESDYAVFPSKSGDDSDRPPLSVDVLNTGSSPMELTAAVGPEMWLVPEAGWNATPIAANSFRPVRLTTRRNRAPNGSALPRYTYFTVTNRDGESARLLVQDNTIFETSTGRSVPEPGDRSFIIPTVVTRTLASGSRVVSRIRIANVSGEAAQAEIFFTPADADGFDATKVKRAAVVIPPNDVVTLTDPLQQVFGLAPPSSGLFEIRVPPERISMLLVSASVDTLEKGGGSRGYSVPAVMRGEGARQGSAHVLGGVTASASLVTDLTLAETTGREATTVQVTLYKPDGSKAGERAVPVPRYGRVEIAGVSQALGGGASLAGGRLEIEVTSGGGAVIATALVRSSSTESGATLVSQLAGEGSAISKLGRQSPSGPQQAAPDATPGSNTFVIPIVINGIQAFAGDSATWRMNLTLAASRDAASSFHLTYRDEENAKSYSADATPAAGKTLDYSDALTQLFGIATGARSRGSMTIEATGHGRAWARLVADLGTGPVGDAIPVVNQFSEALTGAGSTKPLYTEGLEMSVDAARGTRSILVLTEVGGEQSTLIVRLYEAGNRTQPIAQKAITVAANGQVQLDTVFSELGLENDQRKKDRTNVQCVVTPASARGLIAASIVTIDNKTGEATIRAMQPAGGTPVSGLQTVLTAPTQPERRRPVRR